MLPYICTELKNITVMKITKKTIKDPYGAKSRMHKIELDNGLNLGNNFHDGHFRAAIEQNEEREELHDYLWQQDVNDSFEVVAAGNFGPVSSGVCSVMEAEYIFEK